MYYYYIVCRQKPCTASNITVTAHDAGGVNAGQGQADTAVRTVYYLYC